jgi:hypothetical protein
LEGKKIYDFQNNWKVKRGFGEFLNLPFKKSFKKFLKQNCNFTDEIYNIMEKESLDVEKTNENWDLIKNQKNIKCKFLKNCFHLKECI